MATYHSAKLPLSDPVNVRVGFAPQIIPQVQQVEVVAGLFIKLIRKIVVTERK